MRLYEEGLIDLDAPITEYIPFFILTPDSLLLSRLLFEVYWHTDRIARNSTFTGMVLGSSANVLETLTTSLADTYQAFPVGYRYKYSNIGYERLGRIIEVMRGIEPQHQIHRRLAVLHERRDSRSHWNV